MKNVKVVLFPGAPVNVEVEGNESIREVFVKAGFDAEGRELKLDGKAVEMNDTIGQANMLIAMKKIKGNAELKVINFPGAPITIETNSSMTVEEAFDEAGIDANGRELKLDGRQVELGDFVNNGRMLIAMKKIKGNVGYEVGQRVRAIDGDAIVGCYGFDSPTEGIITGVDNRIEMIAINDFYMDAEFVINNFELVIEEEVEACDMEDVVEEYTHKEDTYIVDAEAKASGDVLATGEVCDVKIPEEHICTCDTIKKRAEIKLEELVIERDNKHDIIKTYIEEVNKVQEQIDLLVSILG